MSTTPDQQKSIVSLATAVRLLKDCKSVLIYDVAVKEDVLVTASFSALTGDPAHEFLFLMWKACDQSVLYRQFAEGGNARVLLCGDSLTLMNFGGDEITLTPLFKANLTERVAQLV